MKTSKAKGRSRARVGSTGGSASGLSTRDLNGLMHDAMLHQLLDEMGAPKEQSGGMLSPFGRLRRIAPDLLADKRRVEWLESESKLIGKLAYGPTINGERWVLGEKTNHFGETLREAIDAAMGGPNNQISNSAPSRTS